MRYGCNIYWHMFNYIHHKCAVLPKLVTVCPYIAIYSTPQDSRLTLCFTYRKYPSGSPGSVGSGAMLDVTGFVSNTDVGDSVSSVAIVSGGRGYATPPSITLQGGGGTGGVVNCTIDQYGAITTVTVVSGGRGYNRGGGASGTAVLTSVTAQKQVSVVTVQDGGSGFLVPPEVVFTCPGGGESCFGTGDVSNGAANAKGTCCISKIAPPCLTMQY